MHLQGPSAQARESVILRSPSGLGRPAASLVTGSGGGARETSPAPLGAP